MADTNQSLGRMEVLEKLRGSAIRAYGPEEAREAHVRESLEAAAAAVWHIEQEGLEAMDLEPWCNG